jgi:hypothetical protein
MRADLWKKIDVRRYNGFLRPTTRNKPHGMSLAATQQRLRTTPDVLI